MSKKINKLKLDSAGKKRLTICLSLGFALLILLVLRISWLQFVKTLNGHNLKEEAYKQQIANRTILPKRGNIYDATGKGLAYSAEVDSISVNPSKIQNKEQLAQIFTDLFSLDYNETLEKLNSDSSSVKIADKIEHDKILQLEKWLEDNKITSGITINSDYKRFYPHNNLASNLLGFIGTDKHGLSGLENSFDSILYGTAGKAVVSTDSVNGEIPNRRTNLYCCSGWK